MTVLPKPCGCPDTIGIMGGSKQSEVDFDNAMKRFFVRADVVTARKCRAAGPPDLSYQSKLRKPNHKLVLRNDPCPYNYFKIIHIFRTPERSDCRWLASP